MKRTTRFCLAALLCAYGSATVNAQLAVGEDPERLPVPTLQHLAAQVPLVREAYAILQRTGRATPGDLARSRELVAQFDDLLAAKQRYIDWLDELRRAAPRPGAQTDLTARLRQLRDSHRSYLDSLPPDFAGRTTIRAQMQQLNLAMSIEEQSGLDQATVNADRLAELYLHAGVFARTAFAHFEVAKARLQQSVLHRAVARQAKDILAALDDQVLPLLEFNAAVVGDPRLARRPQIADSELVDQIRAYGEYRLRGERFDRRRHCDLAEFKAWEALQALAQRLGVVLQGESRESCVEAGGTVGVWLAVPQANVVRFREDG